MSAQTPVEQKQGARFQLDWRLILRILVYLVILQAVLFIAAGRLDWTMAWIYTGLMIVFSVASRLLVWWKSPDLIAERAEYASKADVKPWDKVIVPLVTLLGPLVTWIVAGLDMRFGWSPKVSLLLQIAALIVVALGYLFSTWAMVANRFFAAVVRIQTDRGHRVVSDGPYRYVRHPGYAGGIVCWLATPIVLGTLWAFIPVALMVGLVIVRTALEDRTLQAELAGYQEYARRVRYRLIPGVW